jgi:hypothetical protein
VSVLKRLLAVLLALCVLAPAALAAPAKQAGLPAINSGKIAAFFQHIGDILRFFTNGLLPVPRFQITYDETMSALLDDVDARTGLDLRVFTGLPMDFFFPARSLAAFFAPQLAALQKTLDEKSQNESDAGKHTSASLLRLLSVTVGMAKEVQLACEPVPDAENLQEIVVRLVYNDGRVDQMRSKIYYDTEAQQIYGGSHGILSIGYNFSAKDLMFYTLVDVWMREMGYGPIYDVLAHVTGLCTFDTIRFPFAYDGKEWQIQIWKGRYFIAIGGEIGVYQRDPERDGFFYDCAPNEAMLPLSLTITQGQRVLVQRPEELHWWATGFTMTDRYFMPWELTLEGSVTVKDEAMLAAFTAAIDKKAYKGVRYTVEGLTVSFRW